VHEGTDTSANLTVGDSEQGSSLAAEASIHESPVRENRTPGSVRGLSGNWQSYRAQLFSQADNGNAQLVPAVERSVVVAQVGFDLARILQPNCVLIIATYRARNGVNSLYGYPLK
jgi:hypothetical protein